MVKKIILTSLICIASSSLSFSQEMSNIDFINIIADKDKVTFEEAARFFVMIMGNPSQNYEKNLALLKKYGITDGIKTQKNEPLKRGVFALMMARHLNLKDSLLYMVLKIERYAYRACVANGLMHYNGSEWDTISGGELIEIMTRVSDMTGGE